MRLLRFLMPREEKFVDRFVDHSKLIVAAVDALANMMNAEPGDRAEYGLAVSRFEREADVITKQTIVAPHRAFITPFDRSDVLSLIKALDDAVDLIEEVVLGAELYRVTEFDPHMR